MIILDPVSLVADASRRTFVTRNSTLGNTVTDALGEQSPGASARAETALEISLDVSSENPVVRGNDQNIYYHRTIMF